jgi:hypothetical protein
MGLPERRYIKKIQDEIIPQVAAEINQITGKHIPLEVTWVGLDSNLDTIQNIDRTLAQLPQAFRDICCDNLGIQAVQEKVGKILLCQSHEVSDVVLQGETVAVINNYQHSYWDHSGICRNLEADL